MLGLDAPRIGVSGTIASGKSSLVTRLAEAFGVPALPEVARDNPFFGPLGAPTQSALSSQLWFLTRALSAARTADGPTGGILERPPEEHVSVFAQAWFDQGWLTDPERELLFATLAAAQSTRPLDLLLYMDVSPEVALARVQARQRPGEENVTLDYLAALSHLYASFVRRWTSSPVLRIHTDAIDTRDPDAFDLVLSDVRAYLDRRLPVQLAGGMLPQRANAGDAGLDLGCAEDVEIPPLERRKVRTGVMMHIPEGHVGLITPRSSLAHNHGVTQLDGPGVIDAGYRGEVHFLLYNTDKNHTFRAATGHRLGQIVIVPLAVLDPVSVSGLSPSARGTGGIGSSDLPRG